MVDRPHVYAFEEIPEDLPRPPMSALRALHAMSYFVSPRGWQSLALETRQEIAREGARETVGSANLDAAVRRIPLQQVKMLPRPREPDAEHVPPEIAAALGPIRGLTDAEWRGLRALDRCVLAILAHNTRLLGRAIDEILPPAPGGAQSSRSSATVARCEITIHKDALGRVMDPDFEGGRAFVLARVAGRRATRRVSEIFDRHADSTVGPIELDWGVREADSVIFWQAHVSAWDGAFFPSASLLAATTAAVALHDMVNELDPTAALGVARIRNEPWEAGRGELQEPATAVYGMKLGNVVEQVLAKRNDKTLVSAPPMMDRADSAPPAPASSRQSSQPTSSPRISQPASSTPALAAPSEHAERALAKGPSQRVFVLVSVIAIVAVLGLIGLAIGLAHSARLF